MGVSVQQWRAVIGSWCSSGGPCRWGEVEAGSRVLPLLLLAALLLIAGVELNPGPKSNPGPKELDPGPNELDPGPKVLNPGPKELDPGPKELNPGLNEFPGPKELNPGPKELDPGPKELDPGLKELNPGPKELNPGPKELDPGPKELNPGLDEFPVPKELNPGPKELDPGPKELDPGLKELNPGPKELNPGPKELNPGPKELNPGLDEFPGPKELDPGPKTSNPGPKEGNDESHGSDLDPQELYKDTKDKLIPVAESERNQQIRELKKKLKDQENTTNNWDKEKLQLEKKIDELKINAEKLDSENSQLEQEMAEQQKKAENEIKELEKKINEQKKNAENLSLEKSQLKHGMEEQKKKAESETKEVEKKIDELEKKAEKLESEKSRFKLSSYLNTRENLLPVSEPELRKVVLHLRIELQNGFSKLEQQIEEQKKIAEELSKEKLQLEKRLQEEIALKEKAQEQVKEKSLGVEKIAEHQGNEKTIEADPAAAVNAGGSNAGEKPFLRKYKKTPGQTTMKSQLLEVKMAALIYMRAINSGQPFFLATNMEAAGVFDDIIIRIKLAGQDKWTTTLMQLKHKESGKVGYAPLLSLSSKSDFGLVKYWDSFLKVKTVYLETMNDWPWDGEFDDFRFVLCTNAQSDNILKEDENESMMSKDKLLASNPQGTYFHFSTTSPIYRYMNEIISFKNILTDLITSIELRANDFTYSVERNLIESQVAPCNIELKSKKDNLTGMPTKQNVQSTLKAMSLVPHFHSLKMFLDKFFLYTDQPNEGQLDVLISQELKRACHVSSESERTSLQRQLVNSVSDWWSDVKPKGSWLTEHSDVWSSIMSSRIAQLSHKKLSQLREVAVKFETKALERTFRTLQECRKNNILVKSGTNSLVASQVHQALVHHQVHNYIFTGAKEMLKRKVEMISVWQSSLCQGLIIDCDQTLSDEESNDLAAVLLEVLTFQVRLSVVLISDKHCGLTRALQPVLLQSRAVCQWSDLTSESQSELLKYPVMFQGHELPLSEIVGNDVTQINQQLQGTGLSKLLNTGLRVGKDLESLIDYYIPRRLTRDGKEVAIESLADVPDRVVVLIAEPGMGKTVLVTHLTRAAKLADPSTWIVRVNLNDCTHYLANLNPVNINTAATIDFLTHFARSSDWKEIIFKHRLLFSGKIILFVDGVDEVCPHYETTVCSLLKELLNTKIQTLWVTSRHVAKQSLENVLDVASFALVPFSIEDQKQFFENFWQKKCNHVNRSLSEFLSKVMELCSDGISEGYLASSFPQQTRMLAEYFDPHLDEFLNRGFLDSFPEKINIFELYESFVEKKLREYSLEKKKADELNSAVKIDHEILVRQYRISHMHAAMLVLLSGDELMEIRLPRTLNDQDIESLQITGIIDKVVDKKPFFVHRTFAEYFSSLWISENYERALDFLRRTLFEQRFNCVKCFLDLKLCNSKLHEAVINRDVSTIKSLAAKSGGLKLFNKKKTNINQVDLGGRTALHLSVVKSSLDSNTDYFEITRELLKHKADLEVKDKLLQWRPLQYAAGSGSWKMAGLLLQAGGRVDDMEVARQIVKAGVIKEFIEFLSNPNQSPDDLLLLASQHGDLSVVQFLVDDCGADVNCRGFGWTPMHWCAFGGHVDVMRFLLERNASCDEVDDDCARPMHWASTAQVVELLVENGASVNEVNKQGYSPLAVVLKGTQVEVFKCLLNHGADLDAVKELDNSTHWKSFRMGLIDLEELFGL